ncbi:DUF6807 family protein [Oerskovia sp. M15]
MTWHDQHGEPQLARSAPHGRADRSRRGLGVVLAVCPARGPRPLTFSSPPRTDAPARVRRAVLEAAARGRALVLSAEGEGEARAHGSSSRWLAVVQDGTTLLLTQPAEVRPWFVRAAEYPGVGRRWPGRTWCASPQGRGPARDGGPSPRPGGRALRGHPPGCGPPRPRRSVMAQLPTVALVGAHGHGPPTWSAWWPASAREPCGCRPSSIPVRATARPRHAVGLLARRAARDRRPS